MFAESHPYIRRVIRLCLLPYCYIKLIPWHECKKSRIQVAGDLIYIFLKFKYYPDNYGPCRLWEKKRKEWYYYYGSTYEPYQRVRLRKLVQRYEYQILFNDKEFWEYFSRGLQLDIPHYYGLISQETNYIEEIKYYLGKSPTRKIILKPIQGHAGRGVMIVEYDSKGIKIKSSIASYRLHEFKLKSKCVVQEYIKQHPVVAEFSTSSVNTVRIVTLYTLDDEVVVVSGSMRFGQGNAFVDNWSAGGVSAGVDTDTGKLKKYAYDKIGNRYLSHPVSGKIFEGFLIPEWYSVIKMARRVQKAIPFYRLVGCDIAITETGPVLIEANANPDIVYQEQISGPILADKRVFKEFEKYDLLINKYQKKLYN